MPWIPGSPGIPVRFGTLVRNELRGGSFGLIGFDVSAGFGCGLAPAVPTKASCPAATTATLATASLTDVRRHGKITLDMRRPSGRWQPGTGGDPVFPGLPGMST